MSRVAAIGRWLARPRWLFFDAAVALLLVVWTMETSERVTMGTSLLAATMAVALLIRRRWPMSAFCVALAVGTLSALEHSVPLKPVHLAVPLTLYTLASSDRRRRGVVLALGGAFACTMLLGVISVMAATERPAQTDPAKQAAFEQAMTNKFGGALSKAELDAMAEKPIESPSTRDLVGAAIGLTLALVLLLAFAYAVGDNVRGRRAHLLMLETRAADLEREQRQRVALATAAERARISRELHDVVAHGLSVMVVQAQGSAAALRRHPERTEAALQEVIATGRASLAEMRRLLDLARHDPAEEARLAPQPGIAALPDLVDRVRAAGTRVTFTVAGEPEPLPASVDLSAYRIAQEALTNTLKHAGTDAAATVRLTYRTDGLEVEVSDDGTGGPVPADTEGSGLRGIRERISMLGGTLSAGPVAGGGFRVRAVLPLAGAVA